MTYILILTLIIAAIVATVLLLRHKQFNKKVAKTLAPFTPQLLKEVTAGAKVTRKTLEDTLNRATDLVLDRFMLTLQVYVLERYSKINSGSLWELRSLFLLLQRNTGVVWAGIESTVSERRFLRSWAV